MEKSRSLRSLPFLIVFFGNAVMITNGHTSVMEAHLDNNPWLDYFGYLTYSSSTVKIYPEEIVVLETKEIPEDGFVYNISVDALSVTGQARILILEPVNSTGDYRVRSVSDYVNYVERTVRLGDEVTTFYDIPVEVDGIEDTYLRVVEGDHLALQFRDPVYLSYLGGAPGHTCDWEYELRSLTYDGNNTSELSSADILTDDQCLDYVYSVAYVPLDVCVNVTVEYSYGYCSDSSGNYNYGVCGYYLEEFHMKSRYDVEFGSEGQCVHVTAPERPDGEPPLVEVYFSEWPTLGSYGPVVDGEEDTQECTGTTVSLYDGPGTESPLISFCGPDTDGRSYHQYSETSSITVVFTPMSAFGDSTTLSFQGSILSYVPNGYYESLPRDGNDDGGGLEVWVWVLIGIADLILLILIISVIVIICVKCGACKQNKQTVKPVSTTTRTPYPTQQTGYGKSVQFTTHQQTQEKGGGLELEPLGLYPSQPPVTPMVAAVRPAVVPGIYGNEPVLDNNGVPLPAVYIDPQRY